MRPILVLNPRNDATFASFAELLVEEGIIVPGGLQGRLRERYPRAIVHTRELSGEDITVLYVYRDGHWNRERNGPQGRQGRAGDLAREGERIARRLVPKTMIERELADEAADDAAGRLRRSD